jgi:hypothetical protein
MPINAWSWAARLEARRPYKANRSRSPCRAYARSATAEQGDSTEPVFIETNADLLARKERSLLSFKPKPCSERPPGRIDRARNSP